MRVSQQWYQGTRRRCVPEQSTPSAANCSKFVFILSGDHIYKMNYSRMLKQPRRLRRRPWTVGTHRIPASQAAKQFGVIETDKEWRIIGFEEKPAVPKESPHHPTGHCNARWGIYNFQIRSCLIPHSSCGTPRIPSRTTILARTFFRASFRSNRVFAYNFVDETRKMLSTGAMSARSTPNYEANMDLVSVSPVFNPLRTLPGPLRTWQHQYPPAKLSSPIPKRMGVALDSMWLVVLVISGGRVQKSVIGNNVPSTSYSEVSDSIIYNHVNIGRHSRIPPRHHWTATSAFPSAPRSATTSKPTRRRRFHVSDSGIVVRRPPGIADPKNPAIGVMH